MMNFRGFPAGRLECTPVPNLFINLLARIDDVAELKVTLFVMMLVYRKRSYPRYAGYTELLGCTELVQGLGGEENLRRALQAAVARGTILGLKDGEHGGEIYFINDEAGRRAYAKIESGELKIKGLSTPARISPPPEPMPDIFSLYEQNIGMLTPLVADELREAEKRYPASWIADAIREAVLHNKRNIKYVMR
ncbi:MAG: DNA replication protein DnaD, partial [Dehalococcoidales bacterium]|nr:DNA replication protein DnaD [Dehalococcoidales bacterium]